MGDPLKNQPPKVMGEPLGDGFQITDPSLPPVDRPGPGDEYWENEHGKVRRPGELASAVRLTAERVAEMNRNAEMWERDPHIFAKFVARQAAIAVQIGADVMTGTFIGPSANQQRLAAAQFVVKEGRDILGVILKMKGLSDGSAKKK